MFFLTKNFVVYKFEPKAIQKSNIFRMKKKQNQNEKRQIIIQKTTLFIVVFHNFLSRIQI